MSKKFICSSLLVLILVILTLVRFYNQSPALDTNKIKIITSIYPLSYFAQEISQGRASVTSITPFGAEAHSYEPTGQDIAKIERSDLLLLIGNGFESWGDRTSKNLATNKTQVLIIGAGSSASTDPHIWLNPKLAKEIVDKIYQEMIVTDPVNSQFYSENRQQLEARLDKLDQKFRTRLANCQKRDFITSHAAFGYLAKEYSLNQLSVAGLSPEDEPSASQLKTIVDNIRSLGIKYIFFENLVSPKLAQTLASETGAKTLVLNPIEGLSKLEINQGKNYFTEMEANLTNLSTALECQK